MGIWSDIAGAADHAAGSTDEAIGRSTDNRQGGGIVDGTVDATTTAGTAIADVPADAANTITGTGKNTGWFGVADRKLDPRSWDGNQPNWSKPAKWNDGISGFFAASTQVGVHSAGQAAKGAGAGIKGSDAVPKWLKPILGNPSVITTAVFGILALVLLRPLLELVANATDETDEQGG